MKAFTWTSRRERRRKAIPAAPRKRPGRAFATSVATLEGRALLTTIVPVALTSDLSTSAALAITTQAVGSPSPEQPGPGPAYLATSTQSAITASLALSATSTQPATIGAGAGPPGLSPTAATGPGNQAPPPPNGPPGASVSGQLGDLHPHDRLKNHVALAVTDVTIGGAATPEFALADAGLSEVFVKLGANGTVATLGKAQGIDHPLSVTLDDVNNDGRPDLVVANTGGNNVLIFPGLAGGLFGPEVNGGEGFAVGSRPVSVAVADLNHDDLKDLIVANAGSDTVSILYGQGQGAGWTSTRVETIETPSRPVMAVPYDYGQDGITDLFVCDSGSNSVSMYQGRGDGTFDPTASATFAVGMNPSEMFIGRFDKRPQVDLVTVNSGSDDVTFIGGIFGPRPLTQTVSSGGVLPDAAFAVDTNHTGVLDLVVANGGDGHMAYLRAGNDGLQLAGVITQASIPVPTALAASSWGDGGLDFYAAGAGQDAAALLHFDLGIASTFLPGLLGESTAIGEGDEELFSELMPFGASSLELIAVFWAGSPDSSAVGGEWGLREPSTITALYSPTEGQGAGEVSPTAEVPGSPPPDPARAADPSKDDSSDWARFVLGLDDALGQPWGFVEAVAARDAIRAEGDPPIDGLARLDRRGPLDRAFDPDVEAASVVVDEALRLFWSEGAGDGNPPPESPPRPDPGPDLEGVDAPAVEVQLESVPLISSALLLSTRMIVKGSPPRPSMFRKKPGLRGFSGLGDARASRDRPDPV